MKLHTAAEIAAQGGRCFDCRTWGGFCAFFPSGEIAIPFPHTGGFYFRRVSRRKGAVWLKRNAPALFALLPSDVQACTTPGNLKHI